MSDTRGTGHGRYVSLDGLRGLAALVVVLGHALLAYNQNAPAGWVYVPGVRHFLQALGGWGVTAVWLFFVLSGFVLTVMLRNPRNADYGTYVLRRLARLYVPVWGAVLFCLVSMLLISRNAPGLGAWVDAHPKRIDPGLFFYDVSLIAGTGGNVTPLWSLRWEVLFSLLVVLYIAVARRVNPWGMVAVCVALSATGGVLGVHALLYMPMFGIGVAFAHLWDTFAWWAEQARERFGPVAGVLAFALLAVLIVSQSAPVILAKLGVPGGGVATFLSVAIRLAGVSGMVALVGSSRAVGRIFTSRVMVWLGMISFSLYLVHETVLLAAIYSTRSNPIALAVAILLCFPVAWLFYKFVEAPAHRLSRRIGASSVDSAPTT